MRVCVSQPIPYSPAARPSIHLPHPAPGTPGVQVDAGGWSWEGAKGWAHAEWEDWRQRPQQWLEGAEQAAEEWRERLSWEGFQAWQERHWQAFEERQRRRLAAMTEEQREWWRAWEERQRQRLGELTEEGEAVVRREVGAFEERQQRYWAAHHPEAQQAQQGGTPTCPSCRLSFLMLPLLPNIRESMERFGRRTKVCEGGGWGWGLGLQPGGLPCHVGTASRSHDSKFLHAMPRVVCKGRMVLLGPAGCNLITTSYACTCLPPRCPPLGFQEFLGLAF